MEQIITSLSARLHLPEAVVRSGIGILLNFIKKEAAGSQFEKFIAMLPGSTNLMSDASSAVPASEAGGGLLGGLLKEAGSLLGGNLGEATEAIGALQQAGVPLEKAAPLASGFFEHAKEMVGSNEVSQILEQIPALKSLLGTTG